MFTPASDNSNNNNSFFTRETVKNEERMFTAGASALLRRVRLAPTKTTNPVSYTHLDVYKRQLSRTIIAINKQYNHFKYMLCIVLRFVKL